MANPRDQLRKLKTPQDVQKFVGSLRYNPSYGVRSPSVVLETGTAHCVEAAVVAAVALRIQGRRPLIWDLVADNDDDHVVALFQEEGHWGAISKYNFGLHGFREPIHRTLRELAISYFDVFVNSIGEKTLREYSRPLDLTHFDRSGWEVSTTSLDYIEDGLNALPHYPILTRKMIKRLSHADSKHVKAAGIDALPEGTYIPKRR